MVLFTIYLFNRITYAMSHLKTVTSEMKSTFYGLAVKSYSASVMFPLFRVFNIEHLMTLLGCKWPDKRFPPLKREYEWRIFE